MYEQRFPYVPDIVFISGATGDFGQSFAKRFAELGCKLILHGRSREKLDALSANLDTSVHQTVLT